MFPGILKSRECKFCDVVPAEGRISVGFHTDSGTAPVSHIYIYTVYIRSYSVSQREAIFRTAFRSPESSEKNWEVPFQCPATARNLQHQDLVKIWEDKIMPKSLCGWTQNGARITIWEGFKHRIGMLSLHGNHWKSCPEAGLPRGPI